jgi:hypothetical protein
MPTRSQISEASTTLDVIGKAQLLSLIRESARYREQVGLYPNLESVVDAASAVQIQQLNAALTVLDNSGNADGEVELSGGEDAVLFSQQRERESLISYMISVLYDSPVVRAGIGVAAMTSVRTSTCCSRCGAYRYTCHCP